VTLASDHDWKGVWIGSTVGMALADALAIGVGRLMHRRLPEQLLRVLASLLFLIFGLWMLFDSALGLRPVAIAVTAGLVLAAATAVATQTLRRRPTKASITERSPEAV
jgi:Ca2+/H+ antiporter, TMEM165/GDT1 family